MQQIYWRKPCESVISMKILWTPMQKCHFQVAKQLYWNHTSAWVFSSKFTAYFQKVFYKNTSGGMLLTLQWLLPCIVYAKWKAILRNLNYVYCLNTAPMEKEWFMALMEYNPIGKDIKTPMANTFMVESPNRKRHIFE